VELKTMKTTRTFLLVLAVALMPLAGCDHDDRKAVETGRDAEGRPTVHVDGEEVNRELDQASEHVERGAERAGAALERGAEQAGAALERGAEKVQREVGPIVEDALDDATITAKVKANLISDPEVRALSIDVDTIDGRVTLQGKVATEGQKAEAEKLARITPGVRGVVNLIQVGGS
jgi:hyperosmotically inducible periplasmic protein